LHLNQVTSPSNSFYIFTSKISSCFRLPLYLLMPEHLYAVNFNNVKSVQLTAPRFMIPSISALHDLSMSKFSDYSLLKYCTIKSSIKGGMCGDPQPNPLVTLLKTPHVTKPRFTIPKAYENLGVGERTVSGNSSQPKLLFPCSYTKRRITK
jgi:hypothetical protein